MYLFQNTASHTDKPPSYYIEKFTIGPKAITSHLLVGFKTTIDKADSDWISDFIFLDGLVALENAMSAYEHSPTYDFHVFS